MSEVNGRHDHGRGKRINTIGRALAFKISKYLRKHKDECLSARLTAQQVGEMVEMANELPAGSVSIYNLRSICRDFDVGKCWVNESAIGNDGRGERGRFLADQLLCVCVELDRLCRLLGETFDPDKTINLEGLRMARSGRKAAMGGPPDSAERKTHSELKPLN